MKEEAVALLDEVLPPGVISGGLVAGYAGIS